MGFLADRKSIKYRIRIFHDNYHIKTVTVKAKGQRFVTIIVENPILGHKEKLAFMIPHDIKPFVFKGQELEFNYDIRDATPLSDLTDLIPEFIYDLYEDFKTLLPILPPENPITEDLYEPVVINAEIVKKNEVIQPVDPPADPENPQLPAPTEPVKTEVIKKKSESGVIKVTKDSGTLLKEVIRLHLADDSQKREKVKKIMAICSRHPKLYYWLPAALDIDKEIMSLVSAKAIYRTGVMPSYYAAQSGALISEKVLERPKEQPSWIIVALVGVIIFGIIAFALVITR
jgi:hypothetical protein